MKDIPRWPANIRVGQTDDVGVGEGLARRLFGRRAVVAYLVTTSADVEALTRRYDLPGR